MPRSRIWLWATLIACSSSLSVMTPLLTTATMLSSTCGEPLSALLEAAAGAAAALAVGAGSTDAAGAGAVGVSAICA